MEVLFTWGNKAYSIDDYLDDLCITNEKNQTLYVHEEEFFNLLDTFFKSKLPSEQKTIDNDVTNK